MDSDIIWQGIGSGVVSGVIAGLLAFALLWVTRRGENKTRALERREAAARSLIPALKDTVDTAIAGDAAAKGQNHLSELRNQIALAEGPLRGTSALEEARSLLDALGASRAWVRAEVHEDDPYTNKIAFRDTRSDVRMGWEEHGLWLGKRADRLVMMLHATYDSSIDVPARPVEVPLPPHSRAGSTL